MIEADNSWKKTHGSAIKLIPKTITLADLFPDFAHTNVIVPQLPAKCAL